MAQKQAISGDPFFYSFLLNLIFKYLINITQYKMEYFYIFLVSINKLTFIELKWVNSLEGFKSVYYEVNLYYLRVKTSYYELFNALKASKSNCEALYCFFLPLIRGKR